MAKASQASENENKKLRTLGATSMNLFIDPEQGRTDPLADRQLPKISIAELLGLQLAAAFILLWEFKVATQIQVSYLFIPLLLTTWVACRLRYFPFFTFINPFSVGVLTTTISYLLSMTVRPSEMTPYGSSSIGSWGQALCDLIILGLSGGLGLGLISVLIADPIMSFVNHAMRWFRGET